MKLKKIFTVILMAVVILSLCASYLFTGLSPRQSEPVDSTSDFVPPTTEPFVKGPTAPPPGTK